MAIIEFAISATQCHCKNTNNANQKGIKQVLRGAIGDARTVKSDKHTYGRTVGYKSNL